MIAEIAGQVREAEVLDGGELRWNRGKASTLISTINSETYNFSRLTSS